MIRVSGLNKFYNKGKSNELHVINNTTLELPDTGLICILGESGSGKTTLMNTISGLDDFEDGLINVDGTEIKKYGDQNQERVRNEKFGYIFQNYYLLQDRTVEYNLELALGLYNITEEEKTERIDYVLKAVDMWRYKKRLVSQLSGGQQQRIAIARALAKSPKVIFADEPTGNLDEANTMRTMGVLKKISKKCLVVVVTHEKSIADFFADRILWISDGTIQSDNVSTSRTAYQFIEDTNIYLGEYEKAKMSEGNVSIDVYDRGEKPDINIKLICDNGKVYISLGDAKNVEILTNESEKKVLEGKKPVLELTDVDDLDYSLEELEYAKKPKLGIKEIKDIAMANIKAMGKRQIFLVISLLAMSIMIVLAVQDIMTIIGVNPEEVVTSDSHYVELVMEKGSLVNNDDFLKAKTDLIGAINNDGKYEIVLNPETVLNYTYSGFTQLASVETTIGVYTFVPLDKLSDKDLYYGEMPKNSMEIVVDRWVLEQYIKTSNELSNVINNVQHFIGKQVEASNGVVLTIVGISDTEEMSIYISKEDITKLSKYSVSYMTYSQFKDEYQGYYDGQELGLNESGYYEALTSYDTFMASYSIHAASTHSTIQTYEYSVSNYEEAVRRKDDALNYWGEDDEGMQYWYDEVDKMKERMDSAYEKMLEHYGVETYEECIEIRSDYSGYTFEKRMTTGAKYTVVGFYGSETTIPLEQEIIIADEAEENIETDIITYMGKCYIYADDSEELKQYINSLKEASTGKLSITLTNNYDILLDEYKDEKSAQFNTRIVVTATIFAVSMIILYFMMKASAVQRMQDLGVYRLIGISKGSIIGLFAFENMVITSYTSLVGASLATLATYMVSTIPSLNININYPWYAFLLTVLFLYGVNVVVGILPIRKILRLPPAQLASKYDI